MNELMIFNNPEFGEIRSVQIDGDAWLVGKDVALALGYKEPTKAAREKVDAEDRGVSKIDTPSGTQEMTIINESGLYSLVLSSKLPTAKKFKRWVTAEVLPIIRKTGQYQAKPACIEDVLIQSLEQMKEVKYKLTQTNQRIDDMQAVIALNPNSWREEARHLIARIAQKLGGFEHIRDVNAEVFQLVDERSGASLATRLTKRRQRMALEGVCKSKQDKLTKVDIIADDKKLVEIYLAIVKEMAIKYGVGANQPAA